MAGNGVDLAVLAVLAYAWADYDGPGQSRHAANHMHDGRTSEINVAVPEPKLAAQLREPAAAPYPVAENRIGPHGHEEAEEDERAPFPTLGQRARRDCHSRVHKDHREDEKSKD